jgi:hypothetical protein
MASKYQMVKTANASVHGTANPFPLNGIKTGEVSDMCDNLFTPAGYIFAIWGMIYAPRGFHILSIYRGGYGTSRKFVGSH